jgi:hypothetical protein
MGWSVIAFGQIEVEKQYNAVVMVKLKELVKQSHSVFTNVSYEDLNFEMQGNKGVDYTQLKKLSDWSIKMDIPMTISTSEYSESDGGFYFDTEENKAELEQDEKRMSD